MIDTGDTAWMLVATGLVLLMTPALGLFYAGLVRSKNTLNTFMMCVAAIAVATVTWAVVGYSIAFDGTGGFAGGLDHAFLQDVAFTPREGGTIPHLVFFAWKAKKTRCGMLVPSRGVKATSWRNAWSRPPAKPPVPSLSLIHI